MGGSGHPVPENRGWGRAAILTRGGGSGPCNDLTITAWLSGITPDVMARESNDPGRLTARVVVLLLFPRTPAGSAPRGDQPPRMLRKQSLQ
jgi:hypothetical protein